jgi:hypothetical protein
LNNSAPGSSSHNHGKDSDDDTDDGSSIQQILSVTDGFFDDQSTPGQVVDPYDVFDSMDSVRAQPCNIFELAEYDQRNATTNKRFATEDQG